jgi:hypothetical protein
LEKYSNILVSFKIHLSIITNAFLCFKIHSYTFQIHYSTFQKPYILLTYVTIPLPYSNIHILPYTLKLSWNLSILYFFVLFLYYFSKLLWRLIILPKFCCTCHNMFIGIQKWSIFHESHKSYWLIKYLNLNLISWDTINTCWTYICQSWKPSPT